MYQSFKNGLTSLLLLLFVSFAEIYADDIPRIFPVPQKTVYNDGYVELNKNTVIAVPLHRKDKKSFATELLQAEFSDKYFLPLNIFKTEKLPAQTQYILLGSLENPLVAEYCQKNKLTTKLRNLGNEGYILRIDDKNIVIASVSNTGVLYGFQSLRQLIKNINHKIKLPKIYIEDKPVLPIRGIKLYLPGHNNIAFFKRFIREFMVKYKFNTLMLELNANMRLESHPELNIGTLKFADDLNYSRRGRPAGPHKAYQNSSHHDVADGEILEKEEVSELLRYIRQFNIEVIPEIPSLTHAYYLLFGHKNLAEIINTEYPDSYCPLKPENYKIYFDVLDEYIDVIHPKKIHIGHDEWRMEKDVCKLCKGKDYGKLFADDINKIYSFLAKKGVKTAIWGDHLLESVRGKDHRVWKTKTGYEYNIPGALTKEQVKSLIPKDILIFNWFWAGKQGGVNNDKQLSDLGFQQVYGNLRPEIQNWESRIKINGVLGGAPSSWAATTEYNFGKDLLYDFLGCANLLWSSHYQTPQQIAFIAQKLMPQIRRALSGEVLPSWLDLDLPMETLNLSEYFNSSLNSGLDSFDVKNLVNGQINDGKRVFNISKIPVKAVVAVTHKGRNKKSAVKGMKIGKDVSSIIFLQSCVKEAKNQKAYKAIWDFDDTADLLGWYEVVYEDGFVETIPIRYGVNILDWQTSRRILNGAKGKSKYAQNKYAYQANLIHCSKDSKNPIDFFAFEWKNKRFGKNIKEINLIAVNFKKNNENAIILLAVTTVGKEVKAKASGEESE